jgi:hypothetical protein
MARAMVKSMDCHKGIGLRCLAKTFYHPNFPITPHYQAGNKPKINNSSFGRAHSITLHIDLLDRDMRDTNCHVLISVTNLKMSV